MEETSYLWLVEFYVEHAEERAHELLSFDLNGVELCDDACIRCYFRGTESALKSFSAYAQALGFHLVHSELFPEKNWVAQCAELLVALQIGDLAIQPVLGEAQVAELPKDPSGLRIPLIVGTGFGSGHHESTKAALEFLQDAKLKVLKPKRVLDLGTGSGILAIAAVKLYASQVTAIEIDPQAIENAKDNCRINLVTDSVDLILGSLDLASPSYDLILANIYAEPLIDFAPRLKELLAPKAFLILAGIASEKWSTLLEVYQKLGFNLLAGPVGSRFQAAYFQVG